MEKKSKINLKMVLKKGRNFLKLFWLIFVRFGTVILFLKKPKFFFAERMTKREQRKTRRRKMKK